MAFVYRKRTAESGDIAEPRDLMDNLAALIGEFNGGLDADNIQNKSITSAMVPDNAFIELFNDKRTTDITFDGSSTEWRKRDGVNTAGTDLHEETYTLPTDAMLEVEWGATWTRTGSSASDFDDDDGLAFRLLCNGTEIARHQLSARSRSLDHTYMLGVCPVQGGKFTICVEIRQWTTGSDAAHEQSTTIKERELIVRAYKR